MRSIILSSMFLSANLVLASSQPCSDIQRSTEKTTIQQYAPAIAKQLKKDLPAAKRVSVLEAFKYADWQILRISTDVSEDAYLFYSKSPLQQNYINLWAGFATEEEGPEVQKWVQESVKGIPAPLAKCFVWHVTRENQ